MRPRPRAAGQKTGIEEDKNLDLCRARVRQASKPLALHPPGGAAHAKHGLLSIVTPLIVLLTLLALLTLPASSALATGDVNDPFCKAETESSPGFRSFLPDCRAYELVTPEDPANAAIGIVSGVGAYISEDGERVIGTFNGALAGVGDREENNFSSGAEYEFSRTPTGWVAESINLPAAEYPGQAFVLPSTDLSRTLWEAEPVLRPGEEFRAEDRTSTLVVREAAGAGAARVRVLGPTKAPGAETGGYSEGQEPFVVDTSADLSHVLLNGDAVEGDAWPGDTTLEGHRTLYEYGPESKGEPVLVGVRNHGPLRGTPVNAGAQLISQCGIELGGTILTPPQHPRRGTTYNAVSANGEAVYFTAYANNGECEGDVAPPVNELYARVAGAQTLDVSEPPLSGPEAIPGRECTATCAEDESEGGRRSRGVYQGASADGTKVFFTSEQPLVNGPPSAGEYLYEETLALGGEHSRATSLRLIARDVSGVARVAENGERVAFLSTSVLSGIPNANGEAAQAGSPNLYVYDSETGETAFVAREPSGAAPRELHGERNKRIPFDMSADGEFLVFESARQLQGTNDSSTVNQIFEYDAATGAVARVSIGEQNPSVSYPCPATGASEAGYACDGNTTNEEDAPEIIEPQHERLGTQPSFAASSDLSVSERGVVVFTSRLALAPGAVEGTTVDGFKTEDVYEYSAGNVYLISPPEVLPAAISPEKRLLGLDASGADVFFWSTESLVPQDGDSQVSWYDARTEGGFPAPPTPPGCIGEACQGAASIPPQLPGTPASAAASGGENIAPPSPAPASKPAVKPKPKSKGCRKGYVKKKGKCVRSKAKKSAIAGANRGPRS